jgi:hypothetical protein
MSYEKSDLGRVARVIRGRHGPALKQKRDIFYLSLNSLCPRITCGQYARATFFSEQIP